MKISCYRGGAWDTTADVILAGDGVFTVIHSFGLSIPFPRMTCTLRGLAPLRLFFKQEEAHPEAVIACGPSYHVLTEPILPLIDEQRLYHYVIARNGVFLLARSRDVDLCLPIPSRGSMPHLADARPHVQFRHPLVEKEMVTSLLDRAFAARDRTGFQERLFCLTYQNTTWQVHEPPQKACRESVEIATMTPEYIHASIVGHSHHELNASFSHGDDLDEITQGWFKIFFVLGTITTTPTLLVRICAHGYSWEVAASTFFHLPAEVQDGWKGRNAV